MSDKLIDVVLCKRLDEDAAKAGFERDTVKVCIRVRCHAHELWTVHACLFAVLMNTCRYVGAIYLWKAMSEDYESVYRLVFSKFLEDKRVGFVS